MKQNKGDASHQFFLVLFLFISVFTVAHHIKYLKLLKSYKGISTGHVIDMWERSPNLCIETFGKYQYTVNDTNYERDEMLGVDLNYRPLLKVGDSLIIHYNIANPKEATAIQNEDFIPTYLIE